MFKKATKYDAKLKMAIAGPPGSGKTYSALSIAKSIDDKVALIDTERGSASKYADLFDFDVLELVDHHPNKYIQAINEAANAGYKVLIIDSLSHAWNGKNGALELVDKVTQRQNRSNSFNAWREVTPLQNKLIDSVLSTDIHVITTMRTKTEYLMDRDERGKTSIKKIGLTPIQRDGVEYEFDVVAEIDSENTMSFSKTRCSALQGEVFQKPGQDVGQIIKEWLPGSELPETLTEKERLEFWEAIKKKGWTMKEGKELLEAIGITDTTKVKRDDVSTIMEQIPLNDGAEEQIIEEATQ